MKIIEQKYSKSEIDRAGKILMDDINDSTSQDKLNHWRLLHNYPLNTFQATLRKKIKFIDNDAIIAQRLKRTPSIISKLKLNPSMSLSRMQDIGGLRAIVKDIESLNGLVTEYKNLHFSHELKKIDDYILKPKISGYRGVHFVYKYRNNKVTNFNGLQIELQFRTRLQHYWATAVETIGTFLGEPLKASIGSDEWLEYLMYVSNAFAFIENTNRIDTLAHLTKKDTYNWIRDRTEKLQVFSTLNMFKRFVNHVDVTGSGKTYYLVVLDIQEQKISYGIYPKDKLEEATFDYAIAEKKYSNEKKGQAVLVSADSVNSLKRAYPNYFLDASGFEEQIKDIIEGLI